MKRLIKNQYEWSLFCYDRREEGYKWFDLPSHFPCLVEEVKSEGDQLHLSFTYKEDVEELILYPENNFSVATLTECNKCGKSWNYQEGSHSC